MNPEEPLRRSRSTSPPILPRMIEDAEERGLISPGATTLVEPTSGNMGIALAYIALARGYRFVAVMPAEYSLDKQILLRYLGADLVLTDPALGFQGQLDKLEQLRKEIPNAHVLDQFANAANPEAHFRWTGPEIWKDTAGKVDIFVAGSGTGGTVSGVGRYLKTKNPAVKVVCVEPAESPVISGGKPSRHKIQGVGPGFVPKNLDTSVTDEIVTVTAEDAMANARRLAREEGLLVGISSGANLAACLKVASRQENRGKMIVTVFPSGGERSAAAICYFSAWNGFQYRRSNPSACGGRRFGILLAEDLLRICVPLAGKTCTCSWLRTFTAFLISSWHRNFSRELHQEL